MDIREDVQLDLGQAGQARTIFGFFYACKDTRCQQLGEAIKGPVNYNFFPVSKTYAYE